MIKAKTSGQWQNEFRRNCIQTPGQHISIYGITGSGKTTVMFWLLEALRVLAEDETLVWFDIGKMDEAATLMSFGPVRFIIPRGMSIDVKKISSEGVRLDGQPFKVHPYEVVEVDDATDPWPVVRPGWINVICVYPFIIDPISYANVVSKTFNKLIRRAHNYDIITPMAIFIDEFHILAPASGHGLSAKHYNAAAIIQLNIDKLRATGIRIIGSSQGITKLRKGVRSAFNWTIIKRGVNFRPDEEPKLHRFNSRWQNLEDYQLVIVFPTKKYSDIIEVAYYPRGREIASIRYYGIYEFTDKSVSNQKVVADA